MRKQVVKIAAGLRWFLFIGLIGFGVVLFTAPSLFGHFFIATSALLTVLAYAALGSVIAYVMKKAPEDDHVDHTIDDNLHPHSP